MSWGGKNIWYHSKITYSAMLKHLRFLTVYSEVNYCSWHVLLYLFSVEITNIFQLLLLFWSQCKK